MERKWEKAREAVSFLQKKSSVKPEVGLILGSGLGVLADEMEAAARIPYADIPHFPTSTVQGHAGCWVSGMLGGVRVCAMQGRFHFYEGHAIDAVTFPVYVMKLLGVRALIVTNAAGGMNPNFSPGDLMLITDHLNFTGQQPLIGSNDERLGTRFPDMSEAYAAQWIRLAEQTAEKVGIPVQKGVYAGITGPNYMTSSELKMLSFLGGDAIGMSTVPEVIAANHAGLGVLGITCITDMALGEETEPLTHEQVVRVANETRPKFIRLVREILSAMSGEEDAK